MNSSELLVTAQRPLESRSPSLAGYRLRRGCRTKVLAATDQQGHSGDDHAERRAGSRPSVRPSGLSSTSRFLTGSRWPSVRPSGLSSTSRFLTGVEMGSLEAARGLCDSLREKQHRQTGWLAFGLGQPVSLSRPPAAAPADRRPPVTGSTRDRRRRPKSNAATRGLFRVAAALRPQKVRAAPARQLQAMFTHCRGSPLPRAMFPPPSITPRTASMPRSRFRTARLPESFAVRLRTSKPRLPRPRRRCGSGGCCCQSC